MPTSTRSSRNSSESNSDRSSEAPHLKTGPAGAAHAWRTRRPLEPPRRIFMDPTGAENLARLRRAAQRTTDWRFHCWYWGDAIAIDGLLAAHPWAPPGGGYRDHVLDVCHRWNSRCPPNFDDALVPGASVIQLVMDGDLPKTAAERVLDRLDGLPRAHGCIPALEPHRPPFRFGVCIDAVYHLPATYAMAARWSG